MHLTLSLNDGHAYYYEPNRYQCVNKSYQPGLSLESVRKMVSKQLGLGSEELCSDRGNVSHGLREKLWIPESCVAKAVHTMIRQDHS